MKDKRVLYVSSEVIPYLPETEISSMSFEAPRLVNNNSGQIRIFMPRYGNINERRHQLHEVIRLSGIAAKQAFPPKFTMKDGQITSQIILLRFLYMFALLQANTIHQKLYSGSMD